MLSVIVPIYNVEKYLEEALESLKKQELKEIEFILIIDGATDHSAEICEEFTKRDSRFKLIFQENEGYGKTCNRGIDIAKGDYIAIFEPDDRTSSGMYRILYELAKKHNVDIVRSSYIATINGNFKESEGFTDSFVSKNTKDFNSAINPLERNLYYGESSPAKLCFDPYLMFSRHPSIWANIYRKSFLQKNGIPFMKTPGASFQDFAFHVETMTRAKNILFVDDAFYFYRIHPNNSSSKGKQLLIHLDIFTYLLDDKRLFDFVAPYLRPKFFRAFMSQHIWWLNKNKSIFFAWAYSAKMAEFAITHSWTSDPTAPIVEQKLVESYLLDSHFTQFFYTIYTMFISLGNDHRKLKRFGMRIMRPAEWFFVKLGIVKNIRL